MRVRGLRKGELLGKGRGSCWVGESVLLGGGREGERECRMMVRVFLAVRSTCSVHAQEGKD